MRNTKERSKGITLVALVITIIILLILAGIIINSLTGSGLFEKAKLAKEKSENAQLEENKTLGEYTNSIEDVTGGSREENYKTWKRYMMNENGYVVGSEEIDLPQNFEELHINIKIKTTIDANYTFNILFDELEEEEIYYMEGIGNALNNFATIAITKEKVKSNEVWFNGNNFTQYAEMRIWYK